MTIKQVRDLVEEYYQKAEKFFGMKFPRAKVTLDLTGTSAGQFKQRNKNRFLRFNRKLLRDNPDHFREDTIPHEVAHAVQRFQDEQRGQRSQPHGKEWKYIMVQVFRISPKVTHSLDVSKVRKNTKPYKYACDSCSTVHKFGPKRHGSMKKAPLSYRCKCGGKLKYAGKVTLKEIRGGSGSRLQEFDLE